MHPPPLRPVERTDSQPSADRKRSSIFISKKIREILVPLKQEINIEQPLDY